MDSLGQGLDSFREFCLVFSPYSVLPHRSRNQCKRSVLTTSKCVHPSGKRENVALSTAGPCDPDVGQNSVYCLVHMWSPLLVRCCASTFGSLSITFNEGDLGISTQSLALMQSFLSKQRWTPLGNCCEYRCRCDTSESPLLVTVKSYTHQESQERSSSLLEGHEGEGT